MVKRKRVIPLHPSDADLARKSQHFQATYNVMSSHDVQIIKSNLRWATKAITDPDFQSQTQAHKISITNTYDESWEELQMTQTEYGTLNACREKETGPLNKCIYSR